MENHHRMRAYSQKDNIFAMQDEDGFFRLNKKYISMDDLIDADWIFELCTGLKDKNDKLIYEGDIISHCFPFGMGKGIVTFMRYRYGLLEVAGNGFCEEILHIEEIEIIGNIHEELLEGNGTDKD